MKIRSELLRDPKPAKTQPTRSIILPAASVCTDYDRGGGFNAFFMARSERQGRNALAPI
jgi:hypothetical protein